MLDKDKIKKLNFIKNNSCLNAPYECDEGCPLYVDVPAASKSLYMFTCMVSSKQRATTALSLYKDEVIFEALI